MNAPLLVIHGTADPVYPIEHGVAPWTRSPARSWSASTGRPRVAPGRLGPDHRRDRGTHRQEAADDSLGRFVAQRAVDKVDDFALQKNSNGQWSPDGIRLRSVALSNDIESIRRYFALNP